MTGNGKDRKPSVLIPYLQLWDIADHIDEWLRLSEVIDFIKYRVTDVDAFKRFFKASDVECLWVTDDFVESLGGPSEFWEFYPKSLKAMVVPWVGCDFIDGQRLRKEKNIVLCNIGPNASDSVADAALLLVLSCFRMTSFWEHCFRFAALGNVADTKNYIGGRELNQIDISLVNSNGSQSSQSYDFPEAVSPSQRSGLNMSKSFTIGGKSVDSPTGKNALILGFGSIGQTIGKRLSLGLGMNIYYYKRTGSIPDDELGYNAKFCQDLSSRETWYLADVIVVSLPGTASTKNIINEKTLSMCKDGVRIVNVGRGTCVDENALINALNSGKVNSCGLDVFKDENTGISKDLLRRWDVTLLPHIGSAVSDMVIKQTIITLQNIKSILIDGKDGIYPIN